MQNNLKYIDLSWAVVGVCERPRVGDQRSGMNPHQPLLSHIPGIDKDEAAAVGHYVIGYLAFWHIAFVDEKQLQPCHEEALRTAARQKIDRYIEEHSPVETLLRFYLVLLRQQIAPMEQDGMSRVYQV